MAEKTKRIEIPLPINIGENHLPLYQSKSAYHYLQHSVKKYNNVFVSHYGISLKSLKLLPNSLPNIKGNEDLNFYREFWKTVVEQYLVCKFGKSLKSISLNGENEYALIYGKWFGYFSWVVESLPRLMMLEKEIKNYTILYPEGWKGKNFVNESLKLFPDLKTKIIESDNHMFVKKLVLPESKQWTNIFDPEITQQLRLRVWDYLKRNNISKNLGDKIYVSREKAKRRKVVNEVELTQYLEKMDFQIINFEDYTFWEQVAIMKDTKLLISVHGAGLANINFMPAHSFLIELTKKTNGNEIGRISYWRLSASLNINYLVQFCETQDDVNSYDSDIYVDWEQLQKNLSLISNFKLDIN